MEGMLTQNDERTRQTERLIAELSPELCAIDPEDLDTLIEAILPRISEAVRADSIALIADGVAHLGVSYRTVRPQVAVVARAFQEAAFDERREQLLARRTFETPQALRLVSCETEIGKFEIFGAYQLRPVHVRCVVIHMHERFSHGNRRAWVPSLGG